MASRITNEMPDRDYRLIASMPPIISRNAYPLRNKYHSHHIISLAPKSAKNIFRGNTLAFNIFRPSIGPGAVVSSFWLRWRRRSQHKALGVDWKYRIEELLSHTLNNRVLPMVDSLVQRLVPSTTDVTFQCPNWT
ncbi:unnamed protein product [Clonostachys chloroleuca]|uniref:Uncharacterized protein n=1 Tax=Clonostachys chloroleuca TaxID=1926264 RepID=A0AA35Q3U2_9HYPO|nr:unnamed protein product [Clonostachys chloroleuca]